MAVALLLVAGTALSSESAPAPAVNQSSPSAEAISQIAARLIADAIPREYQRSKDWGQTKSITTGLRSSGNFFEFDIHRRKKQVKHGIWKTYRVLLVEPEKNLLVRIDNLRSIGPGRTALTLVITARLHGWARAKVYERGIHIIALEAEADSTIHLSLDAEISLESVETASWLSGVAIRPVITDARLTFDDFRLSRISDLRGSLAQELGNGLRHLIEDELTSEKLTAKLNRAIEKRRDRLQFTPDMFFGGQ
jgi:hypothetical protein